MNYKTKTSVVFYGIGKAFYWFSLTILLLLIGLFITLQSSAVQTWLVSYASKSFYEQTGHKVTIAKVDVNWFDEITLDSLEVKDLQDTSMITINRLLVDFSLLDLLRPSQLHFDAARITGADVRLVKFADDQLDNISFLISQLRPKDTTARTSLPRPISVSRIKLEKSRFSLNDMRKDSIEVGFNYYQFTIDSIFSDLSNFYQRLDTVKFRVDKLAAGEKSKKLKVNSLQTNFLLTYQTMELSDLDLYTQHSHLQDYVKFEFSNPSNLTYFVDSVNIIAHFDSTTISNRDLRHFSPYLEKYDDTYSISGDFSGGVTNFSLKKFSLYFGDNSQLFGNASFNGLPNFMETFIDLRLDKSTLLANDLGMYMNQQDYYILNRLGFIRFDGRFIGFPTDFVANGSFDSRLGSAKSDVNLKLPSTPEKAVYSGSLTVRNLNLGTLAGDSELLQKVSFSGSVSGKGLTPSSADFYLKGNIQKFGLKGYEYVNIKTDARLAASFFEGKLSIDDPNVKLQVEGSFDFRNQLNKFKANASLDTLFLYPLQLTSNDVFLRGQVDLDFQGLEIDSITGSAAIHNLLLEVDGKQFKADSILATSQRSGIQRSFNILSEHLSLSAEGNFDYTTLFADLSETFNEYELAFRNNSDDIESYYANKPKKEVSPYKVSINATLTNINPLTDLFIKDFYIAKETKIEANFNKNISSVASFYSAIDTLAFREFSFIGNEIDINTSKAADSTDVLSMFYISSMRQLLKNRDITQNNYVEAIWSNNKIDFQTNVEQLNTNNYARVYGDLQFLPDRTIITVYPSDLQVLEGKWQFSDNNQIVITDEAIAFENLKLSAGSQEVELTGYISDSTNIPLRGRVTNFALSNLNPLTTVPLDGVVNGHATLINYGEGSIVESDLKIDNFFVDRFLVGNLTGKSSWNDASKQILSRLTVIREGKNIIGLNGYYAPLDSISPLNFTADFDNASINILEPFIEENFNEIKGTATGKFRISGSPTYPILRGTGTLRNGAGRIKYLNTTYSFNGDIFFDDNEIGVRNLDVRDEQDHRASLNGGIFHDGFRDFVLDLEGQLNNFQVLNTSAADNSLYYGTAYATGSINFLGAISNLNISAKATTNRNTRIFIPLDESSDVQVEDFISFVNFSDTTKVADEESGIDEEKFSNIRLDFDLDITPDAYCELIFDIKSGDIIRGRGNGKLNMQIDTNGDFYMFGDLEIEEGGYNFTLYNIINKEFEIVSGSSISWSGDPYKAQMDITAGYRQNALLSPILTNIDSATLNTPELKRRYPTNVQMKLNGDLMSPDIAFDIQITGYPETAGANSYPLGTTIQGFKNTVKTDEQEMKRQVFSLIILRRFSPINSFNVGTNSIGSSVSEFVSNQLSYWISQVDENLEIDIDLASLDNDAYNTFQLRLAYTFLDGRLRVSRDGGVTSTTTRNELGAIMGDWTLEYLLTPDGKLRAKMYSRTSVNSLTQNISNQTNTKAGFSLQYIRSFNNFKDLMQDVRVKNREETDPQEEDKKTSFNFNSDKIKQEEDEASGHPFFNFFEL
ncbi:translocation/assembly module TamB domain-containing protein [Imperialibacter roseus]|uniref:Translocation/assembly module TamB domain-containing protein n=1 Tax=Imperialibacter roseus TaxID=1324217 RepID=A0ABZ0IJF0_9BACT|nr:translocation/assembly module TamB domain-containing protein [Imperialibacter roseus]WOK04598.1 translocation/assembly module TamB domain-containing protein [Imperialibacter roseus]